MSARSVLRRLVEAADAQENWIEAKRGMGDGTIGSEAIMNFNMRLGMARRYLAAGDKADGD